MTEQNNKLYVGNLSYNVNEDELNGFFTEKGIAVESIRIIKDKYTDRSKGFGFAELTADQDLQKAIETLDGQDFSGRALKISQARPSEGGSKGNRRPDNRQQRDTRW
ncbi:MAG: RNA-binding protein [PVC group bacterium]|nr:RNA-binding protein [PVC group bacterium]